MAAGWSPVLLPWPRPDLLLWVVEADTPPTDAAFLTVLADLTAGAFPARRRAVSFWVPAAGQAGSRARLGISAHPVG